MKRLSFIVLALVLAAIVGLSGCSLFGGGRVQFYRSDGDRAVDSQSLTRSEGGGFQIDQLNISTSGSTGIPIVWAADDQGAKVPIRVQNAPDCIEATPAEGLELVVEGVKSGQAVIETADGIAQLPVIVYGNISTSWGYHGLIITADGPEPTNNRSEAHFWSELYDEDGNGVDDYYRWMARVPIYQAATWESFGPNQESIANVKTVDFEQLDAVPEGTETWLFLNRTYVAKVPEGYVKLAYENRGLFWFFSPTPEFP